VIADAPMARVPQTVIRIMAFHMGDPPVNAEMLPSRAKKKMVITYIGITRESTLVKRHIAVGIIPPNVKDMPEAKAA